MFTLENFKNLIEFMDDGKAEIFLDELSENVDITLSNLSKLKTGKQRNHIQYVGVDLYSFGLSARRYFGVCK